MEWYQYVLVGLAALAAGFINALAGGGTLISFPALNAIGIPAVAANVTNTVALVPGYLGATIAQLKDLQTQKNRLWFYLPAAVIGGLLGGFLLLNTGEKLFRSLIPYLILLASLLLAIQEPLRAWLLRRLGQKGHASHEALAVAPVFAAAVYGGYFGAGLSVIVLAALGLLLDDSLTRLNAAKQAVGFAANTAAAALFLFSGQVHWTYAVVMAAGAVAGGAIGGRLAGKVRPATLRAVVVSVGLVVGIAYLLRG